MTKAEAIAVMKDGGKVRHRYFSDNEWMTLDGHRFLFEDGVRVSQEEFWFDRRSDAWEDDWFLADK